MEMQPLRSFLVLARERHVTRAARLLNLTQPAVSTQLKKLEEALQQRLFHRTSKGLELTDAGALFVPYVEAALATLADGRAAVEQLAGLATGRLAIGGGATATTALLPPLLRRYHAAYPGIRLYLREQGSREVAEAIVAGTLDLGVVTLGAGATPPGLTLAPWVEDELLLIVPPGHRLAGAQRFRWAELRGEPLVLFEPGSAVRALIDGRLADAGVTPDIVMELRSIASLREMVAEGIGCAFVSRFALSPDQPGLRPVAGPLSRPLALARRSDRPPSPAAAAFIALVSDAPELARS